MGVDSDHLVLNADRADRATSQRRKLIFVVLLVFLSPKLTMGPPHAVPVPRRRRKVAGGSCGGRGTADTDAGSVWSQLSPTENGAREKMAGNGGMRRELDSAYVRQAAV